jgi:exodeoxyribonuclease VII large subunit
VIGVITSERGAVIQDIRTTILRRFPRTILLWPVPVQGEGAAERVAAAIQGFDALAPGGAIPRPDVLIVARGGGSLEDLMAFNEEVVVRAVAACRIPVISAVGHETDTTLIDFAADRRAPTPTAAAEMAVPARSDLIADLEHRASRLVGALNRLVQEQRLRLSRAERGLPDLPSLVGTARQRLDDRAERLVLALPNLVGKRRAALAGVERRLPDAPALVAACRERVQDRGVRLIGALPNLVQNRRAELELCGEKLVGALRVAVSAIHHRGNRTLLRFSDAPLRHVALDLHRHLEARAAEHHAVAGRRHLQVGDVGFQPGDDELQRGLVVALPAACRKHCWR